ncbi:MAG: pentapeptide repeat-containing protein [Bauldia sp.]
MPARLPSSATGFADIMRTCLLLAAVAAAALASPAAAQTRTGKATLSVFDLTLAAHARQLPAEAFIDYACGTNGGPPSTPIADWSEFGKCAAERGSGLLEVYFRYDDEPEFVARARYTNDQIVDQQTSLFNNPIIVSALFEEHGFLAGYRIASDPRASVAVRENGANIGGFLLARFGEDRFVCADLPRGEGETPYQGLFIKRRCTGTSADGLDLVLEVHRFRKPGQAAVTVDGPTSGQFESTTYFQATAKAGIGDWQQRLAALPPRQPSEKELLVAKAKNCPGCDLRGANLKRANLTGANLAGADLRDANLHDAVLTGANLTGAKLQEANLNRADLRRAKFAGALLSDAMLYAARLDGADLSDANLDGLLAARAQFASVNLSRASLVDADIHGGRINDSNLSAADFSRALLDEVQLVRSNLAGATFTNASMRRAGLAGANLTGSNMQGADLFGANLREANMNNADFSKARLTSAVMTSATMIGAKFEDAQVPPGFAPER